MLLETGQVDVNAQVNKKSGRGDGDRFGEVSPRSSLVRAGRFQDSGGWTPIIWAAEHKHVQVIRVLLNRGADVTIVDKVRSVQRHVYIHSDRLLTAVRAAGGGRSQDLLS